MNLFDVDWSKLPTPADDGGADHLPGMALPDLTLPATNGQHVNPSKLDGTAVFYVYPMTGRPDRALPDGWDDIPGARGCTPQSCAFRDHYADLQSCGVTHLFGVSTQDSAYQAEAAQRLHLPYPLLSDADLLLGTALRLPQMQVAGQHLLKRLTMITRGGIVTKVFYPVFPPDTDARNVLDWLQG